MFNYAAVTWAVVGRNEVVVDGLWNANDPQFLALFLS